MDIMTTFPKLRRRFIFLSFLLTTAAVVAVAAVADTSTSSQKEKGKRVAIIGGGIAGTFTAKYLSDYDQNCNLDSIVIYEPYMIAKGISATNNNSSDSDNYEYKYGQGSRVSSLTLQDGKTNIELGASIIFSENKLIVEMIKNDPNLKKVKPHAPGSAETDMSDEMMIQKGMGIYNGKDKDNHNNNQNKALVEHEIWPLLTSNLTSEEVKQTLMYRYNLDLYKVDKATNKAMTSFQRIYDILNSTHISSFENLISPNTLWDAVGLGYPASVSLNTFLDHIKVSSNLSWWRRLFLSNQGSIRNEFLTAINLCNNNKNNDQMTGLAGLVNFIASKGDLFAIQGGNQKLIQSAFQQAQSNHDARCIHIHKKGNKITHVPTKVKTIVSDYVEEEGINKGMELFDSNGKKLGLYDVVIVATPLQFCDISFVTRGSLFDHSVLHPMALNSGTMMMMQDHDSEEANSKMSEHGHKSALHGGSGVLPDSAKRPYTQVVTTIISNAILNHDYFSINQSKDVPRQILMTENGKNEMGGISSIGQITKNVYKVFSSNELSKDQIYVIFGSDAIIEYVKVWGGTYGGATPDFNGGLGDSSFATNFLLYDGDHHGISNNDDEDDQGGSSALYYVNSMEAAVSAIEISAIGAKAVAKLVAFRLKLLSPIENIVGDEL